MPSNAAIFYVEAQLDHVTQTNLRALKAAVGIDDDVMSDHITVFYSKTWPSSLELLVNMMLQFESTKAAREPLRIAKVKILQNKYVTLALDDNTWLHELFASMKDKHMLTADFPTFEPHVTLATVTDPERLAALQALLETNKKTWAGMPLGIRQFNVTTW